MMIPVRPPLLLVLVFSPTFAIRVNNVVARSPPDSPPFAHDGYVGQIVQVDHEPLYMHEQWHNRHVELATANDTEAENVHPANATALSTLSNSKDWDDEAVEHRCITILSQTHDMPTNPAGMEPCYNVRSIDIDVGTFEADLRIFQVSVPREGWQDMKPDSLSLIIDYEHAEVAERQNNDDSIAKRNLDANSANGEGTWEEEDHSQGNDWLRLGSSRVEPKQIGALTLSGTVHEDGRVLLDESEEAAKAIVTPRIRISAMKEDGHPLSIELGLQAASFIAGVFAEPTVNLTNSAVAGEGAIDIEAMLAAGSKLEGMQLMPIVVACVWAVLVSLPKAYGVWRRVKKGREYRRKMKEGGRLDVTIISWD